jgi:hypothetical protein
MSNIATLQKITFTTMDAFLSAVNQNFAVIENSPLYKGISGDEGPDGGTGLTGTRGSQFIFVTLAAFQNVFPGELTALSDISLAYVNSKLGSFDNTQLLIQALGTDQLVNKDIVVLSNTEMLTYDFVNNIFIDTGVAFNTQTSLQNSIEQQIETYVQFYIANDPTLNSLENIIQSYSTLGKNFPDTNNSFTTNSITSSTVYSPFIPGFNSQIGVPITNHQYFGFTDAEWPLANAGTQVFGSIKKYYQMLMATVTTDGNNTLNSAFAPGVNNIPTAVFMQDTQNNGIMVGYKGSPNLRAFGTMYKNNINELVIQSDQGSQASEYSQLLVHANYLKYAKLVQFLNSLQVSLDLTVGGDMDTAAVNTGKFTAGAVSGNQFNTGVAEFGYNSSTTPVSVSKHVATKENFPNYVSKVLITDPNGDLLKTYIVEKTALNIADETDLNQITVIPNSNTSVLTSDYFAFLANKINNIESYAGTNYWRKDQFGTGVIPAISVSGAMSSGSDTLLAGGMMQFVKNTNIATLTATQFNNNAVNVSYGFFKSNVLVTDSNGNLSKSYSLDAEVLNPAEITTGDLAIYSQSQNTIISTYHYAHLAQKINAVNAAFTANTWSKAQFNTFEIPDLSLSGDLNTRGNVNFAPNNGAAVFHIDKATGTMTLGSSSSQVTIATNALRLQQFVNAVLTTDGSGNVQNTYAVETGNFATGDQASNNPITISISSATHLATSANVSWLAVKINNILSWIANTFWTRTQLSDGSVSDLRATNSVKSDNIMQAGSPSDPTLLANGANATVGKSNGITTIRGTTINFANRPSVVLVTDGSGNLISNYSIETSHPAHLDQAGITANYWASGSSSFDTIPNSAAKVLTSDFLQFVMLNFNSIRALIFNRPTYAELNALMPSGGIIMWTNKLGGVPSGWTICDGRQIGSTGVFTDNMVNKFIKGSASAPGVAGGNPNSNIVLTVANLPNTTVPFTTDASGLHSHVAEFGGDHTHSYVQTQGGIDFGNGSTRNSNTNAFGGQTGSAGGHTHTIDLDGQHTHTGSITLGSANPVSVEPDSFTAIFIIKN